MDGTVHQILKHGKIQRIVSIHSNVIWKEMHVYDVYTLGKYKTMNIFIMEVINQWIIQKY